MKMSSAEMDKGTIVAVFEDITFHAMKRSVLSLVLEDVSQQHKRRKAAIRRCRPGRLAKIRTIHRLLEMRSTLGVTKIRATPRL